MREGFQTTVPNCSLTYTMYHYHLLIICKSTEPINIWHRKKNQKQNHVTFSAGELRLRSTENTHSIGRSLVRALFKDNMRTHSCLCTQTQTHTLLCLHSLVCDKISGLRPGSRGVLTIKTSGSWLGKHTHTNHHNYFLVTRAGFHDNRQGGREKASHRKKESARERKREREGEREYSTPFNSEYWVRSENDVLSNGGQEEIKERVGGWEW